MEIYPFLKFSRCVIVPYEPTPAQQIKHRYWHESWKRRFLWPETIYWIGFKSTTVFRADAGTPSDCVTSTAADNTDACAEKLDPMLHQWMTEWFRLEWTSWGHLNHPCWTPLFKHGHLQQVAQDHVQEVFQYLRGWRHRSPSGSLFQCSVTLKEKFLFWEMNSLINSLSSKTWFFF